MVLKCKANSQGYFTELSESWEIVLGFTQDELMSRPFIDFVHPEDRERTLKIFVELKDKQKVYTADFENRYRCKDGNYVWIRWYAQVDSRLPELECEAKVISGKYKLNSYDGPVQDLIWKSFTQNTETSFLLINREFEVKEFGAANHRIHNLLEEDETINLNDYSNEDCILEIIQNVNTCFIERNTFSTTCTCKPFSGKYLDKYIPIINGQNHCIAVLLESTYLEKQIQNDSSSQDLKKSIGQFRGFGLL